MPTKDNPKNSGQKEYIKRMWNKNIFTINSLPIKTERWRKTMPLKFTDLYSPPAVTLNCDNQKIEKSIRDFGRTANV